jgi:hypothetical protein
MAIRLQASGVHIDEPRSGQPVRRLLLHRHVRPGSPHSRPRSLRLFYRSVSRRPRLYTQHLAGHTTQLPPPFVHIDTVPPGSLRATSRAVVTQQSEFRRIVDEAYLPTPWLTFPWLSGHLQTFFAARATPSALGTPLLTYKRELLHVEAGSPFLRGMRRAADLLASRWSFDRGGCVVHRYRCLPLTVILSDRRVASRRVASIAAAPARL